MSRKKQEQPDHDFYDFISASGLVIKWGGKNKQHYLDLGYDYTGLHTELKITNPRHLLPESSISVTVTCPSCSETRMVDFKGLRRCNSAKCLKCSTSNDLTGRKFGRLTAIKQVATPQGIVGKKLYWLFRCECGNEHIAIGSDVTQGKTTSCGCFLLEMLSGSNNGNYNPNLTDEERIRNRSGHRANNWRFAVYQRDNRICFICGGKGDIAHHIYGYHWAENMRYDINNGVTLCKSCHSRFHNEYGMKNNCGLQFMDFWINNGGS